MAERMACRQRALGCSPRQSMFDCTGQAIGGGMAILITGAAGMLGRKLASAIAAGGLPTDHLILAGVAAPMAPAATFPVTCITADLAQSATRLIAHRPGRDMAKGLCGRTRAGPRISGGNQFRADHRSLYCR